MKQILRDKIGKPSSTIKTVGAVGTGLIVLWEGLKSAGIVIDPAVAQLVNLGVMVLAGYLKKENVYGWGTPQAGDGEN